MKIDTDIFRLAKENKVALLQMHRRCGYTPEDLYGYRLRALALLSIETLPELCSFLGSTVPVFMETLNSPVYQHYTIPKKRGGERHIFASHLSKFTPLDVIVLK